MNRNNKEKKPFNWGQYITIIGVVVIFFVIFTGIIDSVYILSILGAICMAYGVVGIIQAIRKIENYSFDKAILQLIIGGFVAMIGIIEGAELELSQDFWNILLLLIVVIILIYVFMRSRNRKKS